MVPNILTRQEAMKVLHVSSTKMNEFLKDPDFPAVKDGRWYIFGDRLEAWLMSKRKQDQTEPSKIQVLPLGTSERED